MSFRKGFIWGAAAASYQVEGASRDDGKGLSVWDMYCRKEGTIWEGQSGDIACDHYHRYREDVALMKEIGLMAYRLSISWPRVLPGGVGKVNEKGLEFYDRLVDELLAAGITPFITLFHWDYPYELYCRSGWLNPASPDWFAEYAEVVTEKLSDRVRYWMTLNEPTCFVWLGHSMGINAPGDKLAFAEILRIAHNVLLAHGKAVQAIRSAAKAEVAVGLAPAAVVKVPASDSAADVEAAREEMFSVRKKDLFVNTWWLDPIFSGRYPEDGLKLFEADLPEIADGDMKIINQPLDFFGVNIYWGDTVRRGDDGRPEEVAFPTGCPRTAYDWAVVPASLYWGPKFLFERYKLPIYITENGMACIDWIALDGKVHDPQRIDFMRRYLLELERAARDGVDVRGYLTWTIMDNFEWNQGYRLRFGITYVDYPTQRRILKDSAYWYREVIASNGENLTKKEQR